MTTIVEMLLVLRLLFFVAFVLGACAPGERAPLVASPRDELATPSRKEDTAAVPASPAQVPHPLAHLSADELERLLLEDPAALGPVSLGTADAGRLWNGVKMPESDRWTLVDPPRAWATPETIRQLRTAIDAVHARFPKTRKIFIGDISREGGGRFGKHLSHQSGRDVDLGFYYKKRVTRWYTPGTEENLDLPRNWALLKALVTETDVELILLDRDIQWLLRGYARSVGEDRAWLRSLFVKRPPPVESPLIQHAAGHETHFHVRFYNPIAQESGRRLYPLAVKNGLFKARRWYARGWAKRGESFDDFLARNRTSRTSFQRANGARRYRPGASFKILRFGPVDPGDGPVVIPPRLLPPTRADRPPVEEPAR